METRPIKELLIIVRDNLEVYFNETRLPCGGICTTISALEDCRLISLSEYSILMKYLKIHKPASAKKRLDKYEPGDVDDRGYSLANHWWTPHEIEPRLKWLNKQINKL